MERKRTNISFEVKKDKNKLLFKNIIMIVANKKYGKCCICGTAKKCAPYLKYIIRNMKLIGKLFEDHSIIIVADHDADETVNILKEYAAKTDNMTLHINETLTSNIRTVNIAHARNICLDYIKTRYSLWDYFIMMDCDNINTGLVKLKTLKENLEPPKNALWDALSFNRIPYYDTWALSIYPLVFSKLHFYRGHELWERYIKDTIYYYKTERPKELIPVYSAFNGFAIYKIPVFIDDDIKYSGEFDLSYIPHELLKKNIEVAGKIISSDNIEKGDCEHRSFHYKAMQKKKARIRLCVDCLFL